MEKKKEIKKKKENTHEGQLSFLISSNGVSLGV